jgi:hypothetical protein
VIVLAVVDDIVHPVHDDDATDTGENVHEHVRADTDIVTTTDPMETVTDPDRLSSPSVNATGMAMKVVAVCGCVMVRGKVTTSVT